MFQVRKRISVIFTAAHLSALDDRSASRFRGFFEPSRLQSVMPTCHVKGGVRRFPLTRWT
jgi:hypothetical protein